MNTILSNRRMLTVLALTLVSWGARAQTDDDAILMAKYNLCAGAMYSHSAWDYYWEGTYRRNNQNLGTVSTQMVGLMGIYGITNRLAIVAEAPYVWTHATAGVLHGMHGIQDLSGWLKWEAYRQKIGSRGRIKLFGAVGGSVPLTNYLADYLPLSIGLQSKTVSGRLIADYQLSHFFVTATGTYTWRSNIKIDEQSYYTTQFIESDKVYMPNEETYIVRAGYRSNSLVIEANLSGMVTLGGFDIRKNDMPFPSNRMDATMAGGHVKYEFQSRPLKGLSLTADGSYTVAGRNVGQSTMFGAGIFYIFDFSHRGKTLETPTLKSN
jgi:hypothetical protein